MEADSDLPGSSKRPPKGNQRAPAFKAPTPEPELEVVPARRRESAALPSLTRVKRARLSGSLSRTDQATQSIKKVPIKKTALKRSAPSAARASASALKFKESGVRLELCCLCDKTETDQLFKLIPYHSRIIFKSQSLRRLTTIEFANNEQNKTQIKYVLKCCRYLNGLLPALARSGWIPWGRRITVSKSKLQMHINICLNSNLQSLK